MSGEGMSSLITALTGEGGISSATLWGEVASAGPLLITIFSFAFGYFIIRKVLKKGSHGKVGF